MRMPCTHAFLHIGHIVTQRIDSLYGAWTFNIRLGRRVRKIIPSCAVTAIRRVFPELDNIYVGYKEYAALLYTD